MTLLGSSVFVDRGTDITMWHVIAFTWGANLAFHGGLGDMTILRFARNKAYGWYSSLGMFIGHFAAWIAADSRWYNGRRRGLYHEDPIDRT